MSDDLHFTVPRAPQFGELNDLVPGMYWVRLPLPLTMNHINFWLLDNGPGWTMIDCGMNTDDIFEIWDKLWKGLLRARPLQNLTLTHAHIDHIGLAGFIVKEHKCATRLPLAEWMNGWLMWHERDVRIDDVFIDYMKRHGASDEEAKGIAAAQRPRKFPGVRPPREFTRVKDGDVISMGKREWRVVTAGGHSPEHASYFCEKDKILIAGDQVLSHITPSIIVSAAQPDSNPMQDYLDSLARFEALPPDTLVLPSHGLPFHGLHTRLLQLREHHQARLDDMASFVTEKTTAFAIVQEVFPRVLHENPRQAFGEALAHLNALAAMGKLKREVDANGMISFAP